MKEYLKKVVIGFCLMAGGLSLGTYLAEIISPEPDFLSHIPMAICVIPAFVFITNDGSFSVKPQDWLKTLTYLSSIVVCFGIALSLPEIWQERLKISFDNPWFTICLIILSVDFGKRLDAIISRLKNRKRDDDSISAHAK